MIQIGLYEQTTQFAYDAHICRCVNVSQSSVNWRYLREIKTYCWANEHTASYKMNPATDE